jgi:hypothetical protein
VISQLAPKKGGFFRAMKLAFGMTVCEAAKNAKNFGDR